MKRAREQWLDAARGFAMLCVVLGHAIERMVTGLSLDPGTIPVLWGLRCMLYAFHVPLFFAVSGWLFALRGRQKTPGAFFRRRMMSLLVPYLVFALAVWIGKSLFASYVMAQVSLDDLLSVFTTPFTYLWFIYVLFFVEMAAYALERLLRGRTAVVFVLTAAAGFLSCVYPRYLDVVNKVLFYLPIFCLGMLCADRRVQLCRMRCWIPAVLLFLALSPVYMQAQEDYVRWLPISLAGAAVWLGVFIWLNDRSPAALQAVGRRSMYVYIIHPVVLNLVRMVLMRLGVQAQSVWLVLQLACGVLLPMTYALAADRFRVLALPFEPGKFMKTEKRSA